jgi:anti-sigma B factor antagonist
MNVNIRKREGVTILDIEGRVIGSDSLVLKHIIDEQINAAEEGEVKILLNLEKVRMVDSSGLGVIVAGYTSVQRKSGWIALLQVSGNIKSLIVMAKLVTLFDRYEDENEAIASFQKDRRSGLWNKCTFCNEFVFKQTLERNFYVCPHCNYYSPMPADVRLRYLFDSDAISDLYPPSIDKKLSAAIRLTDLVNRNTAPNQGRWQIAAGEGTISSHPAILVVVDPYAVPQRVHFVTLLAAIRTALERKLPRITVYPGDTLPKRKSNQPGQPELLSAEITYLTVEMDNLSQACLPQITLLTDQNSLGGFSTKFPLGDLVLVEQNHVCQGGPGEQTNASRGADLQSTPSSSYAQRDVIIDHYVQRQDLPATLSKLLAFFAEGK